MRLKIIKVKNDGILTERENDQVAEQGIAIMSINLVEHETNGRKMNAIKINY